MCAGNSGTPVSPQGSVLLGEDGGRFRNVEELRRLLIVSPSLEDEGLYKCILTFVYEGRRYNVTRQVRLRIRGEYHMARLHTEPSKSNRVAEESLNGLGRKGDRPLSWPDVGWLCEKQKSGRGGGGSAVNPCPGDGF